MRKLILAVPLLAGLPLAGGNAAIIATFGQTSNANTLTATPNAGDTATTITATNVAVDVTQCVAAIGCLGAEFLDITATSTDAAQQIGAAVTQHYSGTFAITSLPSGGINILSGVFTDAIFGSGPSLTLAVGNPPDTLTLTSDIIPASQLSTPSGISFGFTNVSPLTAVIGSGCAQFPNSMQPCTLAAMTAGIAGDVSATPLLGENVPEPSTLALLGVGLFGLGLMRRIYS